MNTRNRTYAVLAGAILYAALDIAFDLDTLWQHAVAGSTVGVVMYYGFFRR